MFIKIVGFFMLLGIIVIVNGRPQVAQQYAPDHFATAYRDDNSNDGTGTFQYGFETSNGIKANANGFVKNPEARDFEQIQYIGGGYSFYTPDGAFNEVTYTADEFGYRPVVKVTRG